MVLLMTIAAVIVVVGTVAPVLHDVIGGRSTAVGGEFFARTVGPLALVAVPFLVLQLRRRRRLPRSGYGWSSVAHAGVLVLMAGVGVSTFDDVATFGLGNGDERRAAGVDVRNDGVTVGAGPRRGHGCRDGSAGGRRPRRCARGSSCTPIAVDGSPRSPCTPARSPTST